jgi:hypothetical protein
VHAADQRHNVRVFCVAVEAAAVAAAAGSGATASSSAAAAAASLRPLAVRVGSARLVAAPSPADAALIREALAGAAAPAAPAADGAGGAPSMAEVARRVEEAFLLAPEIEGAAIGGAGGRLVLRVRRCRGRTRTLLAGGALPCAAAWDGACVRLRDRAGEAAGAGTNGGGDGDNNNDGDEVVFTFEVQLLLRAPPAPAAEEVPTVPAAPAGPTAVVAACLLSLGARDTLDARHAPARGAFERLCDRLRSGVVRTGRKWRRSAARGEAPSTTARAAAEAEA